MRTSGNFYGTVSSFFFFLVFLISADVCRNTASKLILTAVRMKTCECATMSVVATTAVIILLWTVIPGVESICHQHDDPFDYRYLLNDLDKDADHCAVDGVLPMKPCPTNPQCNCTMCRTGVEVNCSYANLQTIPKHLPNDTIQLELQGNEIAVIEPGILYYPKLTFLNISNNTINVLHENSFNGLNSLEILSVVYNTLYMVEKQSLSKLPRLKSLDLSNNRYLEFRSLQNITYGLQNTSITDLKLTKLHNTFGDCTHLCVKELMYLNRTKIENLTLDSNRLAFICYQAVMYFPTSLKYLSLRDNRLTLGLYVHFILSTKILRNVEYLIMSQQDKTHEVESFMMESTEDMHAMKETNIIETKPPTAPDKQHSTNHSTITHGERATNPWHSRSADSHIDTINTKIMNPASAFRRDLRSLANKSNCCSNCRPCDNKISLHIPQRLIYLDASEQKATTRIRKLCFCTPNMLKIIKLHRNMYYSWTHTLQGTYNLTHLDLSENGCYEISETFFQEMENLKFLNVSRNFLGFSLKLDMKGITFSRLRSLTTLDLSNNKLETLPSQIFQGLMNLRCLSLANNQLSTFNIDLQHLTKLQSLKLHTNLLTEIGATTRIQFDNLVPSNHFIVNLSENKFYCTCATIDFVKWISETSVNFTDFTTYTCAFANRTTGQLTRAADIYNMLQKDCSNYSTLVLALCSVLILFLSLVIGGILYRYRWNLRYMYYSAKFRMRGYTAVTQDENGFNFDVFVSYSDTAGGFVRQHILPELEDKRGVRLLIHERDFRAGHFVADNIMQAIATSKKMLIILTQDYMNSTWCKYEMNMARMETIKTGRDVICVLMKEDMQAANLPLEIMDVIQQQTYLELPKEPDHLQQFWDRLKAALVDN